MKNIITLAILLVANNAFAPIRINLEDPEQQNRAYNFVKYFLSKCRFIQNGSENSSINSEDYICVDPYIQPEIPDTEQHSLPSDLIDLLSRASLNDQNNFDDSSSVSSRYSGSILYTDAFQYLQRRLGIDDLERSNVDVMVEYSQIPVNEKSEILNTILALRINNRAIRRDRLRLKRFLSRLLHPFQNDSMEDQRNFEDSINQFVYSNEMETALRDLSENQSDEARELLKKLLIERLSFEHTPGVESIMFAFVAQVPLAMPQASVNVPFNPGSEVKKGFSLRTKILIIGGVIIVLGGGGYLIWCLLAPAAAGTAVATGTGTVGVVAAPLAEVTLVATPLAVGPAAAIPLFGSGTAGGTSMPIVMYRCGQSFIKKV